MARGNRQLDELIGPPVTGLGYELVGIDYHPTRQGALLRVYIDSDDGITLDDCARVSHQVSGVLEVADPIPGHYTLEVSSPGLDRPLFTAEHYARYTGRAVRVRLSEPLHGRRKFTGELVAVRDGQVLVREQGVETALPLDRIARANLVPEL